MECYGECKEQEGIQPSWEDNENSAGGNWVWSLFERIIVQRFGIRPTDVLLEEKWLTLVQYSYRI